MRIKAGLLLQAAAVVAVMVQEGRAVGSKGAYWLGRLPMQLMPEVTKLEEHRTSLIKKHGQETFSRPPEVAEGVKVTPPVSTGWSVPSGTPEYAAFLTEWLGICDDEIEVAVEPIPLSYLEHFEPKQLRPGVEPSKQISAVEFQQLDCLIRDDGVGV